MADVDRGSIGAPALAHTAAHHILAAAAAAILTILSVSVLPDRLGLPTPTAAAAGGGRVVDWSYQAGAALVEPAPTAGWAVQPARAAVPVFCVAVVVAAAAVAAALQRAARALDRLGPLESDARDAAAALCGMAAACAPLLGHGTAGAQVRPYTHKSTFDHVWSIFGQMLTARARALNPPLPRPRALV